MAQPQPLIIVDVDGRLAQWDGTSFTGDAEIVAEANLSVEISASYTLGFAVVTAGTDSLLGAAAALGAYRPGRTRFTTLPEEIGDFLFLNHSDPEVSRPE